MAPSAERSDRPVLEMDGVAVASLHLPDVVLIDDVQWTVRPGEFWVVGGAPASGKSDLLTTAAGLMRPVRGIVRLYGQELARLHEEERLRTQLRVAIVFGDGGRLFNHLSLAENLALPFCYHNNCVAIESEERVRTVLEAMGLAAVANLKPASANRNVRQRAALARALVLSPELLFLDNPFVGVDMRETRWWLEFLDSLLSGHPLLEGRQLTIVAGTDDYHPWASHGHQFALIDHGHLRPMGSWENLAKENNPALRELLPVDLLRK